MLLHARKALLMLTLMISILLLSLAGCAAGTDGKSLVDSKCSTCHSVDFVSSASYTTEDEWTSLVGRMEVKGLEIDDTQRATIIDYLVSQSEQ